MYPPLAAVPDRDNKHPQPPLAPESGSSAEPPRPSLGALAGKLIVVQQSVHEVVKDKTNIVSDYDYASAEVVLGAVRDPIAAAGLVLTARLVDISDRDCVLLTGQRSTLTTVRMLYVWIDKENGETLEIPWAGRGEHAGALGLSMAFTNSTKTFIRVQLLIPQADDPERTDATGQRDTTSTGGPVVLATDGARRYLLKLIQQRDGTAAQAANLLRTLAGVQPLPDERAAAQLEELLQRVPKEIASDAIDHLKEDRPFPTAPAEAAPAPTTTHDGEADAPASEEQQALIQCIQANRGISDQELVRTLCDVTGHSQIPPAEIGPETVLKALAWIPRRHVHVLAETLMKSGSDNRPAAGPGSPPANAPRFEQASTIIVPRPAAVPTDDDRLAGFRA